ncbi:MAG: hypothetical protein BWY92_00290 [Firmicutes bacterium ADurb.BinA052]|nr:MAG: hypothetical protein BWY92_00290 [Firmicutes bacterium ADurb.BinA052]
MISGDHDRRDPGVEAFAYGVARLRPRRILHAHKAQENEVALNGFHAYLAGDILQLSLRDAENPEGLPCHFGVGPPEVITNIIGERRRYASQVYACAHPQHFVEGSLCANQVGLGQPVYGRHPFALTLKGQFRCSGGPLGQFRLVYACFQARRYYRTLSRIADHLQLVGIARVPHFGIAAENGASEHARYRRVKRRKHVRSRFE